jgi:hypothetical protein
MTTSVKKLKKPRGALLRAVRAGIAEFPGYMTRADLERDERERQAIRQAAKELRDLKAKQLRLF